MAALRSWVLWWRDDPAAGGGADHRVELHDLGNHQSVALPLEAGEYIQALQVEHAMQAGAISALRLWLECLLSGLPAEAAQQRALEACARVEGGRRGQARLCLELEMAQLLGDVAPRVAARSALGRRLRRVLAEAARAGLVPTADLAGETVAGRPQAEGAGC